MTKKAFKSQRVLVETVAMEDTTTVVRETNIELNRNLDRAWLMRHLDWALHNGHGVQLSPESSHDH